MKIKISQKQWESIGKKAGWIPRDPTDVSDKDIGPIMTPDEEEEALLGPEEPEQPFSERLINAYNEGYNNGLLKKKNNKSDTTDCPYGNHSEQSSALSRKWFDGWRDAWESKPKAY